ncbi:N-acetylglucosamine kinase [Abyssalbus ytuae]|uniref:N-acetylglucosamine kinase n=1 Tax=Abyssalbus ytuae TaxID=2926907 RepID=A0A9E6ZPC0_9FLAO|nr:N-acetylglucosamine kinase [Abyssalbus ytuae]UOB18409.1 N-acetylglucosamine kinase [Abyssalbus ytuae]
MILIADSGSTKCDWVLLGKNNKVILKTTTTGINPTLLSPAEIQNILHGSGDLEKIKENTRKILFYGAGCAGRQSHGRLQKVLSVFFPHAAITIEEDLTAAVHGATTLPGVVCILGTGSNCCYYDGKKIHLHHISLGYAVMDECSGNYFGKQLLKAYFYNHMPSELKIKFENLFDLSPDSVLKNLYHNENPSAYLAGFARFLIENRSHTFIKTIIKKGIDSLFETLLKSYSKELKNNPLHFVGSIAWCLQEEITEQTKHRNYEVKSFVRRPIDNIIANIHNINP